MATKKKLDINN